MICGIMANQGVALACAYPLDASLAEIQALDPAYGKPAMSDGDQTATLTIAGGVASGFAAVAAPTFVAPGPETVDFGAGLKKIEWDYAMPDLTGAAADDTVAWMYLGVFYYNNFGDGIVHLLINTMVTSGVQLTRLRVYRIGVDVSGFITLANSGRIAVTMDANTGTFAVETSEGFAVLSDDTYTPATPCILSIRLTENIGVSAEHAGKTMSASLVTDLAQMLYPLPDGATDICGNTL